MQGPNLTKRRRNTEKGKRSLIACLWIFRNRITGCQKKTYGIVWGNLEWQRSMWNVKCTRVARHRRGAKYSLNKKEWIGSLFKEWILEKSEIRVNLEWTFVLFTHFGVTSGITQGFRVIPEVTPKWVNNTNVHSKFTLISLFSKIHSLKSEHIHSFLFRE